MTRRGLREGGQLSLDPEDHGKCTYPHDANIFKSLRPVIPSFVLKSLRHFSYSILSFLVGFNLETLNKRWEYE